jgi:cellulose synthase/poly-beta-1,6-N-acetylglucosamine synthase-like glycosyltransferase
MATNILPHIIIQLVIFVGMLLTFFWLFALYLGEPLIKTRKNIKDSPAVSIIIPAYNEEETIEATLRQILALDYPRKKLEIIVVANACKDKTAQIVKKFNSVRLIETPIPGKAKAQNLGMRHAKNEIIVIADADITVAPDTLLKLVQNLENPDTALVIPAVKVNKPKNWLQKMQYYEYIGSCLLKQICSGMSVLFVVPGAFNVYRKSIIEKVGGFDENCLTEDIEIATRLKKFGYRVVSDVNAEIHVPTPFTIKGFHRQRMRWQRGLLEVLAKHFDMILNKKYGMLGRFLMPMTLITPILAMLGYSVGINFLFHRLKNTVYFFSQGLNFVTESMRPAGEYLLSIDPTITVPAAFFIASSIFILHKAKSHVRSPPWYPIGLIGFIFVYPIVLWFHWLAAVFAHFSKARKVWR